MTSVRLYRISFLAAVKTLLIVQSSLAFSDSTLFTAADPSPKQCMIRQDSNGDYINVQEALTDDDTDDITDAAAAYRDIRGCNTSGVTDMTSLFAGLEHFNQDIGGWDVSNVRYLFDTFYEAHSFNQDIGQWDVSSVVDFGYTFDDAYAFNQDIGDWQIGKDLEYADDIITMYHMFDDASSFNQDISDWDMSKVATIEGIFNGASSFNKDLSSWNISADIERDYYDLGAIAWEENKKPLVLLEGSVGPGFTLFTEADTSPKRCMIRQDSNGDYINVQEALTDDDTDDITDAAAANRDIRGCNTAQITSLSHMFFNLFDFNQDIGGWDVSRVVDFGFAFSSAHSFNQDISNWKIGKNVEPEDGAIRMKLMFSYAESFDQDVSNWDMSAVGDIERIFQEAVSFNQDLSGWVLPSQVIANGFDLDADAWDAANKPKQLQPIQLDQGQFTSADKSVKRCMIRQDNSGNYIDVGDVLTNKDGSAISLAAMVNRDIRGCNTGGITSMSRFFSNLPKFNQDIGSWDVSKVTSFYDMFERASTFNQYLGGWNIGGDVGENHTIFMNGIFDGAISFNQNIGGWDMSRVASTRRMFSDATSFDQDISSWDVSSVLDMEYMFTWATAFDADLSGWLVENVEYFKGFDLHANGSWSDAHKPQFGSSNQTIMSGAVEDGESATGSGDGSSGDVASAVSESASEPSSGGSRIPSDMENGTVRCDLTATQSNFSSVRVASPVCL